MNIKIIENDLRVILETSFFKYQSYHYLCIVDEHEI